MQFAAHKMAIAEIALSDETRQRARAIGRHMIPKESIVVRVVEAARPRAFRTSTTKRTMK